MGDKPNPNIYFNLADLENLSLCNGTNNLNIVESVILTNNTPRDDNVVYTNTPPQILSNTNIICNSTSVKLCTPDMSTMQSNNNNGNGINLSGITFLPKTKVKPFKLMLDSPMLNTSPSFGRLLDFSAGEEINTSFTSPITLTDSNEFKSFSKKVRAHVGNLINRKDILQNNKPVFTQSSNVSNTMSVTPSNTPTTPATVQTSQSVRRSSRLFSNSYSVKENNKSPTKNKFVTPKSPSRKTKQRLGKCSLYELNNMDLNARNKMKKEKSETVTSNDIIKTNNNNTLQNSATQIQKHSAEGLMKLLKELGQAYLYLSQYNCKAAIETLQTLSPHQYNTTWVYSMIAIAYFEIGDYENCVKYFTDIRANEPYRIKYMDIYSTALWHLQREVTLSALAQDLINNNKNSPITWIVCGNCFSLHKEHDNAIKFLHRAVQVDSNYPYAYTLLGHEYIMTEELDKAMSCYRNAIRLDPRHYNAWFGIGTIYSKQERFPLAEMNYIRALSINPTNSVIMCHIGVVQHALKKTEKALKTLNHAIANNPKNALCKFHRGSIYFAVGRHAEALKELEELKEIVPKESLVYFLIGKVHKKLGNIDLALMYFSWATGLDPKGASSQMKEGFDPSIERSTDIDSPVSPPNEDYELHDLEAIQEDSDESL